MKFRINSLPYNTLVEQDLILTTNFMPCSYNHHSDIIEYHVLFRTCISSFVKIDFPCTNDVNLSDGPSVTFPKLNSECETVAL